MEKFLLELDVEKTYSLGSSSTVQLVLAPSLPHLWATINIHIKEALDLSRCRQQE